ncbi:MAG: FecR family protein [Aggregatilineales bacterium]
MTHHYRVAILLTLFLLGILPASLAQGEMAAVLEVLEPGVMVQRAGTQNPITVNVEAIVGVGDVITTDATGHARITFFSDGISTELTPNTVYRIDRFEGDTETFALNMSVLAGITRQQIDRVLNAETIYNVETPGMAMVARGTEFDVRVEEGGRSALVVFEGGVGTLAEAETEEIAPGFGVRSEEDGALSDVVRAINFAELDAALDGCAASVNISEDVQVNFRLAPSLDAPRVGAIDPTLINNVVGTLETDMTWYRIRFDGAFAWFTTNALSLDPNCAGLRLFPADMTENPADYETMGATDE